MSGFPDVHYSFYKMSLNHF